MTSAATHAMSVFLMTLASSAARSIGLAAVVAAALAAFRTKDVRIKLFAWKGVLVTALAMPVLMAITPGIRVAVPLPGLAEPNTSASTPVPSPPVADNALRPSLPETAPATSSRSTRTRQHAASVPSLVRTGSETPAVSAVAKPSAPARREIPWLAIIFTAYLAIALAHFVRVGLGIHLSRKLVHLSKAIDDPQVLDPLVLASDAAGLRAIPRLAESEAVAVPVVIGVGKPTILLSAGWRDWDADELAAVLTHEVSHVARRDALALGLALIHRAIFWFSPLGWWLERHLAGLAEQASDEAALAGGMDRTRYAEALLGFFAELEGGERRVWWQAVSMAKAGQAEKRVDRILAWRGAMSNRWKKSLAIAFVALGVPLVVLAAAVRLAPYHVPAPPARAPAPAQNSDAAQAPPATPAPPAAPQSDAESEAPGVFVVPPIPPIPPLHVEVPRINLDVPSVHLDVPPLHVNVPPVNLQIPPIHVETLMLPSRNGVEVPSVAFSTNGDWNLYGRWPGAYFVGRYYDWGPRFAIVTHDSDELTLSGDRDDAEHARELKKKIPGDFIWFERDEKSYIISDPATVTRAKQLWQPEEGLAKQQKDLSKQQEDLARQAEDAAKKIDDMKIKVPDLTTELQKFEEAMKKLNAEGGTMNQIGDLQRQMEEIQRELGEVESNAAREQGAWGRQQGEWGRKMGELGRQQGELARREVQLSRDAARQMRDLLDDAVAKGLAKPEE
jgi:beta-lactamase regulating signal transducer with metallopeptidase domain